MAKYIEKLLLHNFCRFKDIEIQFNAERNILIGDNEAGKSTILNALDIVLSGSFRKVETHGLDRLFNKETIDEFLTSGRRYDELPEMYIELYLNDQNNYKLEGKNNTEEIETHGLSLTCKPNDEFSDDINTILGDDTSNFPFEFYTIQFSTFADQSYNGYNRPMKHLLLDNSQINSEYATNAYIRTIYRSSTDSRARSKFENLYRQHKAEYHNEVLNEVNDTLEEYKFDIKTSLKSNLESDITITEDNIDISNKGKGQQSFIKTRFSLQKNNGELDVLLFEEPENHLSHVNIKKLLNEIDNSENKQIFISTHNSLICSRLELKKAILLNSNNDNWLSLDMLEDSTSKFFMKASDNNILEFIMSEKVILVEGDAEFILMEEFYKIVNETMPEDDNTHIISVGGTSFKRYIELANALNIRTAVIRDNDCDYNKNIVENYRDYTSEDVCVFSDEDNANYTFEVLLYESNIDICEDIFSVGRRSLTVLEYMLANKADSAFRLLSENTGELTVPEYIEEAIVWIKS